MPQNTSMPDPAASLGMLAEYAARRQEDLEKYDDASDLSDSDDFEESYFPVLEKFSEENAVQATMDMINFTFNELVGIWNHFSEHVLYHCTTGRGSKSPIN